MGTFDELNKLRGFVNMHGKNLAAMDAQLAFRNASKVDKSMSEIKNRESSFNGLKVAFREGAKGIPKDWTDEHSKAYAFEGWYHTGGCHSQGKNPSNWVKCFPCGNGLPIKNDGLKALNEAHDKRPESSNCSNRLFREKRVVQPNFSPEIYCPKPSSWFK